MDMLTYDTVARFSMVASLLLFIGLFLFVLFYVFRIASRDRLEAAQRSALDLKPEKTKFGSSA
jgi:cbb3-type cytochrome oxidase subunit 3